MGINVMSKGTGYALFIVSCIFSVKLFTQFAVSGIDKLAWSVAGICFMSGEFISAIVCIRSVLHRKVGFACMFGGLYIALYFVSLFGSLGFQSASSTDAHIKAGLGDEKKRMMQQALDGIDHELEVCEKQALEFSRKGYITKGLVPLNRRIDRLRDEREEKYQALMAYEPEGGGADQFWVELANFVGSDDPKQTKFGVFLLIAVLLDLTGAAMVVVGFRTFKSFIEQEPSEAAYFGHEAQPQKIYRDDDDETPEYKPFVDSGPEPATAKLDEKEPIGFRPPPQYGDNNNDVARYVIKAFETKNPKGHFISRRYLAEEIGLSQKRADEIHRQLKDMGLVAVENRKTIPKMAKDEMLKILRSAS